MAGPNNAAEMELLNNITSAEARKNFDRWFKEDRAKEINDRWAIRRKFLDAKGDDPSLASKYVLVDVLENPGDHKKLTEILTAQIEKKGHTPEDKIWVRIQGCNYVSTEAVCKDLVNFPNIEKLSLGDQIEADDAGCVGGLIEAMPNLTALDLASNKLETQGLQMVLESLVKNKTIIDIDLSGCGIGHSCGKHLAKYIAENTPLNRLLLNGNKLGIYGVQDLSKGLATNTNLETLGLFFNNMGEEGMNHLLNMLREAHAIQDDDNPPESTEPPKACVCPPPAEDAPPADAAKPDEKEENGKGEIKGGEGTEGGAQGLVPTPPKEVAVAVDDNICMTCALPKKLPRTAKNTTLVSCETAENKNTPEQISELNAICQLNAAEAQERELEKLRLEELAKLEKLAQEKKEEEERLAREEAERKAAAEAEKAAKAGAKKGAAKPGGKAGAKVTKPAGKPAGKPAAKASLPPVKKR